MSTQEIDSSLSLAILGLLSMRPLSGYSVRKVFLTTAMKHFSASPGAIYPAMRRLEAARLIKGTTEKKGTLRPRRIYSLTEIGLSTLKAYLSRPVTRDDIIWREESIPLRFTFMGGLLKKEKALQFLREVWQETEDYLIVLKAQIKDVEDQMSFSSRASLELGLEGLETQARWARRTFKKLKNQ